MAAHSSSDCGAAAGTAFANDGAPTPPLVCIGLRADSVGEDSRPAFDHLCRVVDATFSRVDAGALFSLRSGCANDDAAAAFNKILRDHEGGEDADRLFANAIEHKSFVQLVAADKPLAVDLDGCPSTKC